MAPIAELQDVTIAPAAQAVIAREMQLRGEKESAVAAYLAVRLLEIEQLSECVCGLVLIGNEDCPRCEVTGPVED
jgi:hypothetical protein